MMTFQLRGIPFRNDIRHAVTFYTNELPRELHPIPVRRNSDIWNFRLYGTFLAGPERNGISYKVCLISPGTDLPGEWALLALGSVPGLLRQTLVCPTGNERN